MKLIIKYLSGLGPIMSKEEYQPFIKSLKVYNENDFPNIYITIELFQYPLPDPLITLRTEPVKRKYITPERRESWNKEFVLPIQSATELRFTVWNLSGLQETTPIYYVTVPLTDKKRLSGKDQYLILTEIKDRQQATTVESFSTDPSVSMLSTMNSGDFGDDESYCPLPERTADADVLATTPEMDIPQELTDDEVLAMLGQARLGNSSTTVPTLVVEFCPDSSDNPYGTRSFSNLGYTNRTSVTNDSDSVDPFDKMFGELCEYKQGEPKLCNTADVIVPNEKQMEVIRGVMKKLYFEDISESDKRIIHTFGPFLRRDPNALLYFLRTVDWADEVDCRYARELIYTWSPMPLANVILLLSKMYSKEVVFEYAVNRLRNEADNEFLSLYMPQLVWALTFTRDFKENSLSDYIIKVAGKSPALGYLFDKYVLRFVQNDQIRSAFKALPEDCDKEIKKINELVNWLEETAKEVKKVKDNKSIDEAKKKFSEAVKGEELREILDCHPRLPVDPLYIITGIVEGKENVFNSTNAPIKVVFKCFREDDEEKKEEPYPIVYKVGDDMTQDVLILQAMSIMDGLLKQNGVDMRMRFYKALAINNGDPPSGIMEFVKDSSPINVVIDKKGIKANDPDYMDNLMYSYIGSSILTYILGVGDRHLDNILVTNSGQYLHIDFGYSFGKQPKFKGASSEMRIVKEIEKPIALHIKDKKMSEDTLTEEFLKIYSVLRKNANFIIGLFNVREETGLFLKDKKDTADVIKFIKDTLAVGKTEDEAKKQMLYTKARSENNHADSLYDMFHALLN